MGFWDFLRRPVAWFSPRVRYLGMGEIADMIGQMSPARMYREQSSLRTVTSFLGRNVAQLGIHMYERVSDTDRKRMHGGVARLLGLQPNPHMTAYQLVYSLVVDKALYDAAYWLLRESPQGWAIYRLPPSWVDPVPKGAWGIKRYDVWLGDEAIEFDPEEIVCFGGYDPASTTKGSSAVVSLKDTLLEQIEGSKYRRQVWTRGGRVSAIIERPKDAKNWSDAARDAFREDWYAKFTGDGARAGGTPILEDGMTLRQIGFSAHEQQWVENLKLSLAQVASAFHVNPTMVGLLDNANFANVREFRKMLYGETLGPILAEAEQVMNAFLLPRLGLTPETYVEFNIGEKLRGSFEEQAAVLSSSTGAPWMTRNEARARHNLPALEGGGDLVVPLNVLIGGQASPRDSGEQNRNALPTPRTKSRETEPKVAEVLRRNLAHQRGWVLEHLGGQWWDGQAFDWNLAGDLLRVSVLTASAAARDALAAAGADPDSYDELRTIAYLTKRSKSDAKRINAHTYTMIADTLDQIAEDEDPEDAVGHVFDVAEDSGADRLAAGITTGISAWGVGEAGRQSGAATKTWRVTSGNPRSSHAALDGETVPLSAAFSNGLMWPGDGGDPDEVANCRCEMTINL